MTTTLRIDDSLKNELDDVFDQIGLSMTSAINIFLRQVARTRGIPFEISCAEPRRTAFRANRRMVMRNNALIALDAVTSDWNARNNREWTMDEIDAEIAEARRERYARETA